MPLVEIYDEDGIQELLRNAGRKLVVLAFSSGNCGPCRQTTPCLESMSTQMPDVVFGKVDVSKDDELVEQYQITGVPTFHFFRKMQKVYYFQGGNVDFLRNKVEELRFQC